MLGRIIVIITIIIMLALPAAPTYAQGGNSCVVIYVGSGSERVTVSVPSWASELRAYVHWTGLQLWFSIDGMVFGTAGIGAPTDWRWDWVESGQLAGGWGGTRTVRMGGLVDDVGAWTLYACGSPPPTPTPSLPTPTPMVVDGPGCESRVGEPAEWITGSLTIYGPPAGWYTITVYEDPGASGASGVRWRLTRSGGYITPPPEERRGNSSFDVGVGESATITILGADGPGVPGLWVAVSAVCRGVEATPIAPFPDDIRPVEFAVVDEGLECPWELPRVIFSVSLPFLPTFTLDSQGVRICFRYKRLSLAWGDFNAMDWAIPLTSLALVWAAWLSLRRG